MNTRQLSVGLVSLVLLAGAGAWAFTRPGQPPNPAGSTQPMGEERENDEEEIITLDKAPEAVRAAAIKLAGDARHITKVSKEEDDEDALTYEVEYTEGSGPSAVACAAIFSAAGDLMETEKATSKTDLPAAVLAALKKDYPRATFTDPQFVTRMFYEINVVIDGKKHEVRVDASGNIEDGSQGDNEKGEKHDGREDEED